MTKIRAQAGYFFQCREGFESDCAAEAGALAAGRSAVLGDLADPRGEAFPQGYAKATGKSGYATFIFAAPPPKIVKRPLRHMVFARQVFLSVGTVADLPEEAKAAPLAEAIGELFRASQEALPPGLLPSRLKGLRLEAPDTNDGKEFIPFFRGFAGHLEKALAKVFAATPGGVAWEPSNPRGSRLSAAPEAASEQKEAPADAMLCVFFTSWKDCVIGISIPGVTSEHPIGIPRLRFPPEAPSRSTLKLEEAFLSLLNETERESLLRPGLSAVDLGACPGGWTYQFVRREMHVIAVDNGAMAKNLMESGLVEHRREDGFRFRPRRPTQWMVCDMVEQPGRVARLAVDWLTEGHATHVIFNLKLPMKSRYAEVERCLGDAREQLRAKGMEFDLRCRQLYHDREEVTCYVGTRPPAGGRDKG